MNFKCLLSLATTCLVISFAAAQTTPALPLVRLDGQVSRVPHDIASIQTAPFTPIRLQVRVDNSYHPPEFLWASAQGPEIRIAFFARRTPSIGLDPYYGPAPVTIAGLPPGNYKLLLGNSLVFNAPTSSYAETSTLELQVSGLPASLVVTPMVYVQNSIPYQPITDLGNWYRPKHYLALGQNEAQALLRLNEVLPVFTDSPLWTLADPPFRAWPNVAEAPSATVPVCRFFNPTVVTHFYSAKDTDCALLAASSAWVNEGIAFRTLLPVNGVCPLATQPVYRLFRQALSNHRYTQSADTYNALQLRGYAPEGVAFCSPNA